MFVIRKVLFTDADEFIETSLKIMFSLKTKPAKLIAHTAVKAMPATTKTAPAIKIMYPLCSIYKRYITNVNANKFYKLHVAAYDKRNMHKSSCNVAIKIEESLPL